MIPVKNLMKKKEVKDDSSEDSNIKMDTSDDSSEESNEKKEVKDDGEKKKKNNTGNKPTKKISESLFEEDKDLCKICLDRETTTVIEPCHHSVLCEQCANMNLKTCPICRAVITKIIKIYKS